MDKKDFKSMIAYISKQNIKMIKKYQADEELRTNKKISRHDVINKALETFLDLKQDWSKYRE